MTSTAIVAVPANDNGSSNGNGTSSADADLPVDLSQLPMIPMPKTLVLVNNFVANTTRFLNRFAYDCEERMAQVSSHLTRVEIMLAILEAKLNSIPDLTVVENGVGDGVSASVGIDRAELPSTEETMNGVVPPPPPPPPADGEGVVDGFVPPPPPPPGEDGVESTALVVAEAGELEVSGNGAGGDEIENVLKLKDDPRYATYFTMQRHQIPRIAIEQKMKMDGVDPNILDMDPEGPSPSDGSSPTPALDAVVPPPPPPPSYVEPLSIPMPFPPPDQSLFSPASSVSSESNVESLFGTGLPAPPPMPNPPLPPSFDYDDDDDDDEDDDDDDESLSDRDMPPPPEDTGVLKLKDDPAFAKYFKMLTMGAPEGAIRNKLLMDGVTVDILSMDPEGPSPNTSS